MDVGNDEEEELVTFPPADTSVERKGRSLLSHTQVVRGL